MSTRTPERKSKILITVGPSTSKKDIIQRMVRSGVDGFRFNFSHGSMESHLETLQQIRGVSKEENRSVACLADLQGPKIRIGELEGEPLHLSENQRVVLFVETSPPEHAPEDLVKIPVEYEQLLEDVDSGDEIFLSDGQIKLVAESRESNYLVTRVAVEGPIWSKKGFNLPSTELSAPALTEKDRTDLKQVIHEDFDMVALSFVRRKEDLRPARELLDSVEKPIDLIAKIESRGALKNLDPIISSVEGIMVARGDLGAEIGVERVPFYQKEMINKANTHGKIVITATQMLESMVDSPVPTRAEVSDVANAILDGSDAVMLSGETAVGDYPVRTVQTMDGIIRATEEDFKERLVELVSSVSDPENKMAVSMSNAAAKVANEIGAAAIVAPTASGFTARMVSKTYPYCPIIAPCMYSSTRQKVCLYRNVRPHPMEPITDTDRLMDLSAQIVRNEGYADPGDLILILTGLPLTEQGVTNFFHVLEVPKEGEKGKTYQL